MIAAATTVAAAAAEPWLDPELWSWFPGVLLGAGAVIVAVLLAFVGGRGPGFSATLYGVTGVFFALSLVLAAVGGLAYLRDQPETLASGLVWSGVFGLVVFGSLFTVIPTVLRKTRR